MDILMTRYILEVEDDIRLLKLYGNGWYPNFDKYRCFIQKQEKNNENFAKTIKNFNLIRKNDILYETVFSEDLSNISSFFNNEHYYFKSGYGTVSYNKSLIDVCNDGYYISNGIFEDTIDLCLKLKDRANFIVGVCDDPDSVFYKENMKKINELKILLEKNGMLYKSYKHKNHRDKCYMITYRS